MQLQYEKENKATHQILYFSVLKCIKITNCIYLCKDIWLYFIFVNDLDSNFLFGLAVDTKPDNTYNWFKIILIKFASLGSKFCTFYLG